MLKLDKSVAREMKGTINGKQFVVELDFPDVIKFRKKRSKITYEVSLSKVFNLALYQFMIDDYNEKMQKYKLDKSAGKKTLIVLFGKTFGKVEYLVSIVIATMIPVIIFLTGERMNYSIMVYLLIVLSIKPVKIVMKGGNGAVMNEILGITGRMLLVYSLIFAIGWQYPI